MEHLVNGSNPGETDTKDLLSILDLQQDGIVVLDQESRIRYMNETAARLIDFSDQPCDWLRFPFPIPTDGPLEESITADPVRYVSLTARETDWQGCRCQLILIRDISEQKREELRLHAAAAAAETRAAELEALKFVAGHLNQIVLRDDAIQAGLETVLALYEISMAWVLLLGEEGGYQLYAAYGAPANVISEKRILKNDFTCEWLQKTLQGEFTEPRVLDLSDCMRKIGFQDSYIRLNYAIPLSMNGKPLGLLNLVPVQVKTFEAADYRKFGVIGQQFAIAIQRAVPASVDVYKGGVYPPFETGAQTPGGELDITAVSKNVLRLAIELTGAEGGMVGLLNDSSSNLTFLASVPETASRHVALRSNDLFWDVVDNGQAILKTGDTIAEELPMFFAQKAKSLILAPVRAGGRILGLLALYSAAPEHELNDFYKAIAESLGRQAGTAVQNAQLYMEVQQLTVTDSLTGLHNQKSFITQAVREMERTWRYKRPLSIISLVIDDIRSINEHYGRETGDRIMQVLGQLCNESLRKVDIVGRFTGNNFIILLPETDLTGANDVAERLRMKTVNWCTNHSDGQIAFTISLGIASLAGNEVVDLERFIDRANQALYTALQSGGNQALVWEPVRKIE